MIIRFLKSVKYALNGIKLGIKEERNIRIDIVAMLFVWHLIPFYNFTRAETALIVLVTFVIPAFELMNTAVERAVHKPDAEHYMPAGDAKDTAAGAVLIAAVGAAAVAMIMFGEPSGLKNVFEFYTQNPKHILILAVYASASYIFITSDNVKKRKDK